MKVLRLDSQEDGVIVKAFLANNEFRQLQGYIDGIIPFSADTITEPTKAIKTGARHNSARYFLFPVSLRRKAKADTHDFENIKCSCIENGEKLYVIFGLEKKGIGQVSVKKD